MNSIFHTSKKSKKTAFRVSLVSLGLSNQFFGVIPRKRLNLSMTEP